MIQRKNQLVIICIIYFFSVFYIVFLLDYRLQEDFSGSVNLIPFLKTYKFISYYENLTIFQKISFLKEFIGNFFLLFPFCSALEIVIQKKITFKKKCVFLFITCFSIEFLQYIFNLGIMELDDIVLNFLGGIFGNYLLSDCKKIVLASS
jgi:glycopeptide antibiotics resistance protein